MKNRVILGKGFIWRWDRGIKLVDKNLYTIELPLLKELWCFCKKTCKCDQWELVAIRVKRKVK